MDVSLESKSLPSVGYSRKSYFQTTSQRLARDKLVHLNGWRSLALPSVGLGEHRGTVQNGCEIFAAKGQHFRSQRLISQPCNILPSAWSDLLAMAITPSFQLRIMHRLKHWIGDFLSFETTYSIFLFASPPCIPDLLMAKDFKALVLHVFELSIFFAMDSKRLSSILDCFGQSQCIQINEGPHASTSYECTIMYSAPTEQLVIRPHIVPLLPTFHGIESENPYAHIKEFEDVCNTLQEGGASIDLMRLKLFPFTLKDKAKIWLNSLRPRSIHTWTDLQAEFLKKFFPTHRTNGLKRQISNFSAKENEKFYECWERYMEAINACPHHGFDTWLLNPEEAMDFLSYVAEVSRGWDEPNKGEVGKMKSQLNAFNAKAGMYTLNEDVDMKAKFATMTRRLEELELKKMHEVQVVAKTPVQVKSCPICQSYEHLVEECPTIPAAREMFGDQANVIGQFKPNNNASYGNTYNSSWRNHPKFSRSQKHLSTNNRLNNLSKLRVSNKQ
ncbi:hypothetical protein CK203_002380 [Vitis vinifera]|uniref:Retrotransposon gag domain-containing protein n=1 Tax=Vitis vinifera TaxID=29760 RepID=A0A438KHY5_VITVI|nr:hypothetical protein CK203_002380 [Vitis vinifera]